MADNSDTKRGRPPGLLPETDCPTTQVSVESLAELVEPRTSLLVYHRGGTEMVSLAEGETVVVGRAPPADVVLADASLSREHARFQLAQHELWLEDLESTNGSWLNGKRVKPGTRPRVRPGDEVRLGAINIAVHAISPAESTQATLDSHDHLLDRLEEEVLRARTFHHSFALLFVRAARHRHNHLSHWYPEVQRLLRPVDRAALYGPDALTICLPESGLVEARQLATAIVEGRQRGDAPLMVGITAFPEGGATVDELIESARTACHAASSRQPIQVRGPGQDRAPADGAVVVASAAMRDLLATGRRVADTVVPVLIWGETGTGKEVLARTIHEASPRRKSPLRCLNCGAIPEHLVESTLFGHERGAFTGAERQVGGIFEETAGGTVLLDEIGELPLAAQTALLRVIETRRVTRVGSSQEIPVDVRVIAATNRDLEAMAQRGEFRSDLLYRLNAITLKIPPLRDRPEDIPPLTEHFMREAASATGRRIKELDPAALQLLQRYAWPGNVRELRNVIERAVVLAQDARITVEDLSDRVRKSVTGDLPAGTVGGSSALGDDGWAIKDKLRRYEAQLIVDALRAHDWNQTRTAEALGVSRRSLVEKIRSYGIKKQYR